MMSMRISLPLSLILLLLMVTTVSALKVDITPHEQDINISDIGTYNVTLHLSPKDCTLQVIILRFVGIDGANSYHIDGELVGSGLTYSYTFNGPRAHYKAYIFNPKLNPQQCPGDQELTFRVWFTDGVQVGEKFKISLGDITTKFAIACAKTYATAVPELTTMALVGAGVVSLVLLRRFG